MAELLEDVFGEFKYAALCSPVSFSAQPLPGVHANQSPS